MTESVDNRKGKNLLNDWTNNPFERVNHSTNFEDYAICSSDEPDYLCEPLTLLTTKTFDTKNDGLLSSKVTQIQNNESAPKPFKIGIKTHKFEPSVTPTILTHHSSDQRDHSFVDSCLSAGNSSADVTPVGTPQSSPYSIRKVMENNKLANIKEKKNTLSANPKRWFYTGFFNQENKIEDKPLSTQIPRNPSFKNLCISNFDINAVGPTSW